MSDEMNQGCWTRDVSPLTPRPFRLFSADIRRRDLRGLDGDGWGSEEEEKEERENRTGSTQLRRMEWHYTEVRHKCEDRHVRSSVCARSLSFAHVWMCALEANLCAWVSVDEEYTWKGCATMFTVFYFIYFSKCEQVCMRRYACFYVWFACVKTRS